MTQAAKIARPEPGGVTIVFNTNAAANRRRGQELLSAFGDLPGARLYLTETLVDLEHAADEIAVSPPTYVAIAGGDGTISHTITALRRRMGYEVPPVALLRGGSMNMIANSIGAPKNPLTAAQALIAGAGVEIVERDTMCINGHYGFIFGLGLVTNFLEAYYNGSSTGPARAAAVLTRTVGSTMLRGDYSRQVFRRCRGRIQVPAAGIDEIRDWTVLLVQTIENLGIGFDPMYRAFEQPGTFHALGGDISAPELVRRLGYIYRGRPWPESVGLLDCVAPSLRFLSHDSFCYTIDGELLTAKEQVSVHVETSTRFVVPHLGMPS